MKFFFAFSFFVFFSTNSYSQSIRELEKQLLGASDTSRISIYKKLCIAHSQSSSDSALLFADSGLFLAEKYHLPKQKARLLLEKAIITKNIGNTSAAMQFSVEALKIFEQYEDETSIVRCENNIGSIYYNLNNTAEAETWYKRAYEKAQKIGNEKISASVTNNLALIYCDKKEFAKALEYAQRSLESAMRLKDEFSVASRFNNLGDIYFYMNDYRKSKESYIKALKLFDKLHENIYKTTTLNNLAEITYWEADYSQALEYSNEAYRISAIMKSRRNIVWAAKNLTYTYLQLKNYSLASRFLDSLTLHQEHFYSEEISRKLAETQIIYDTEKKQKTIELLNKENELNENKLFLQRIIIISAGISLILLILLTISIFRRYRIKVTTNKKLTDQNIEIQEQKQEILSINEQLENQAKQLRELDEIKTRFFTNISHEFRTPLTLILGPSEQIDALSENAKIKENAQLIKRNAEKLLKLINQLLDISKIEKGDLRLNLSIEDLNEFLSFQTTSFSTLAEEKGIILTFEKCSEPLIVPFDKDKLEKIIANLLSNALKFTPEGGFVRMKTAVNPKNFVEIRVEDNGCGISEMNQKYIFDRFFQDENQHFTTSQGTGIGLALVKELTEIHLGEISLKSTPGKGTLFVVSLPLSYSENPNICYIIDNIHNFQSDGLSELKNMPSKSEKPVLLLAEDNEDMRRYIVSCLSDEYQIIETENGEEALKKTEEIGPDIVLSDVMMPVKNGLDLTKTLKNDKSTGHIPVVLLTAKAGEESKISGLETLADDYITKPFSAKELRIRLNNLLINRAKLREKFEKSITVNPSEITASSVDERFLTEALREIENHITDTDYDVEQLCTALSMSRPTLHRKLKALTGLSTSEFIRNIKLKRAAQLLSQKAGNVSEIAYMSGFNNLSYFTKCFKEQFGMNPSEYR